MTSSMLTGDRRLGSARRGGTSSMKVLGKVVVPKPINLPSQRLENHGLDPNVEIVPKGTLSWGNRSSSASNPWGSQMLSPSADGGSSSPRSHSGRPSSGGSGTRPSTAGSDRAHELTGNAWGPNSRPSSASGALTSNQTALTSLRPRSAETRPGSSHLSRFAEPSTENLVAWGSAGTAEKLGVASSKKDGFSLSSGDFPTLGSEKDNSTAGTQSQDHGSHGRPGSSSGGVPPVKERTGAYPVDDVPANANVNSGSVNAFMRRDNSPYLEDGARSNVEKWQGEPQHYQNANMPHQHFDHWPGAPVGNSQGGVWYRGPPGGPPYPTPVAPGGFPMEPYPYYRPQIPATALANSQPVPPPGVGPRGHHPRGHHMPDAYIRPGMPIRPGFYPGPVAYESYYAPPMGYCNPSDRDIPYMGMAAGPPVYNCYPGQNAPDSNNSNGRSGGFGPSGKPLVPEQRESGHPPDHQGQYKVLLKHNNLDGKEEESNWEHATTNNESLFEKGDQPRMSALGSDRRADRKNDEQMGSRRNAVDTVSPVHVKVPKSESLGNAKEGDDGLIMKIENARLSSAEVLATSKDSTLIQKIESLNAKARASDVRHDFSSVSSRDEQKNRFHVHAKGTHSAIEANTGGVSHERNHTNSKGVHSANEASTGGAAHERTYTNVKGAHSAIEASTTGVSHERTYTGKIYTPGSSEVGTASGEISFEPAGGTALPRRATHSVQGRVDHRGKGRSNAQETDGWRKKSPFADTSSVVLAPNSEAANIQVQDLHASMEAAEKSVSSLDGKDEEDIQAQRAKMRELAKQRAQQLQREEEERTREQKAKALAKLEELNRRTQVMDGSTQKLENVPPSGTKQEEFQTLAEPIMSTSNVGAPDKTLVSNPNVVPQNIEISTTIAVESSILSKESPKIASQESVVVDKQSSPLQEDAHNADAAKETSTPPDNSSASKLKRTGYKQKHNVPLEKSSTEVPKSHNVVAETAEAVVEVIPSSVASNPNVSSETSVHQRRKNYKNGRNKHKQEERSSVTSPLSPVPRETNTAKVYELELDLSTGNGIQSSEQRLSDEAHGRVNNNNQWKSQNNIRRLPRNQQTNNKLTEKFQSGEAVIWAPVRSHNKSEVSEEAVHKNTPDETIAPTAKNKRAEMERYVPKPVANQQIPEENIGSQIAESSQPGVSKGGFKNVEGKQSNNNKQGKAQGSWRQRNSNPSNVHGFQDGTSFTSKPSKNEEESIEHHHVSKPAVDEWDDGWNMPPPPPPPVNSEIPVAKDQGQTGGRGKRQSYKGQKGNNLDFDRKNNIDAERTLETSEIDRNVGSKENHGFGGERASSHWQPKSGYNNQRGSNRQIGGGQNVIRQKNDKEMMSEGTTRVQHEQFKFEKGIIGEAPHTGIHPKRGRKPRGQSPNQGSVSHVEPAPPTPVGEPFRKNGNQNNRSSSHGDWSQDGRQQNVGGNRERQRSNNPNNSSHYEYQPVGPYNKSSNFGGSTDGGSDNNTRSRFRERGGGGGGGGGQKRGGGNFYARQSGPVRVDAVYD